MSKTLEKFVETEYRSRKVPDFRVGDIVRVHQIVPDIKKGEVKALSKTAKAIKGTQKEEKGTGERIQVFEGTVIARNHGREPGATFTVRKIASANVGVEKIYPLYSPLIQQIEIVSRPQKRVRRSKLYFLRGRIGKKARRLGVGTEVEQDVTRVEPAVSEEESQVEAEPTQTDSEDQKTTKTETPEASKQEAGMEDQEATSEGTNTNKSPDS